MYSTCTCIKYMYSTCTCTIQNQCEILSNVPVVDLFFFNETLSFLSSPISFPYVLH